MKKIVTITGHKNTKKNWIARKLAENSDVAFIIPYIGIELPDGIEPHEFGEFHIVLPSVLEDMMKQEDVLYKLTIGDRTYVYFAFQMTANYNVLITDDYGVLSIKDNWDGDIYTIFLKSEKEIPSERVGEYLTPSEFDEIFDVDTGDLDELEAHIV